MAAQYGSAREQLDTGHSEQTHQGYELRPVDISRAWLAVATVLMIAGLGSGILLGRRLP